MSVDSPTAVPSNRNGQHTKPLHQFKCFSGTTMKLVNLELVPEGRAGGEDLLLPIHREGSSVAELKSETKYIGIGPVEAMATTLFRYNINLFNHSCTSTIFLLQPIKKSGRK